MKQLVRIAAWLSQGLNCVFLLGHHNQTVSARCYERYVLHGDARWRVAYNGLNALFFWQEDHCETSYLKDRLWAAELIAWPPPGAK